MVEDQGLVYKGKIEGPTPETSVHQFESKEAPSVTMALRQDKMTPEAIKAKAAAKLVEGAIIPKVDLRATKAAEDWRDMVPGAEKAFKKPNVVAAPTKGESWFHGRRGDIKFEEGRPAFFTRDKEGANWYANERGPKEGKSTIGEFNLDIKKPARLRDVIQAIKETGAIDKDVQAHSVYGGEEENYQDYLYVPKVRENLSKKGFDGFVGHDILENTDLEIAVPFSAKQINTVGPDITENAKQVAESVRKGEGFAADLRTGKPTDTGFLVEVMPENRRILDHDVTPKDIQKFYNDNRQLFKDNPELRVGGYKNELNISAHTEDQAAATTLAKKLDQRSVWDVQKGEEIPTGGQGRVTHFSYPFENRMKDLRHGG
jgi:hypothetical protein